MTRRTSLGALLLWGAVFLAATTALSLGRLIAVAVHMQREMAATSILMVDDQRAAYRIVVAVQSQLLSAKQYLIHPRPELAAEFQERGSRAYEGIGYYLFRDLQPEERLLVERIKEQHALIEVQAVDVFALADEGRDGDAERRTAALLATADSLEASVGALQEGRRAESDRLSSHYAALTRRMYSTGAAVTLLCLASVVGLAGVLRRRLLDPLKGLSRAAERLGLGDLSTRVKVGRPDELGAVASSFNAMAEARMRAEAAVRRNERLLRTAQRMARLCSWETDLATGLSTWSEEGFRIYGRDPRAGPVTAEEFVALTHPDDRAWLAETTAEAIASGRQYDGEFRILHSSGEARHLWASIRVQYDMDGVPRRMFGHMQDITERKRAEMEIVRAKEAAEAANRSKSEFLSSMSHELRTPLNSVIGFAAVLRKNRDGRLDEQQLTYLERIHANGKHLLGLINEVLDLSKIEAGKMEVERTPVDLGALVTETLDELGGTVRGRPVELRSAVPEGLPALHTDHLKLKQVLINLVANAVKFTEEGTVTVRVVADERTRAPLRVEVSDTGPGIAPDQLETIFRAFEQGESGISRRYGGTGLGLTISSAYCALMGYRLVVASEPGRGSTFSIVLGGAPAEASGAGEHGAGRREARDPHARGAAPLLRTAA